MEPPCCSAEPWEHKAVHSSASHAVVATNRGGSSTLSIKGYEWARLRAAPFATNVDRQRTNAISVSRPAPRKRDGWCASNAISDSNKVIPKDHESRAASATGAFCPVASDCAISGDTYCKVRKQFRFQSPYPCFETRQHGSTSRQS